MAEAAEHAWEVVSDRLRRTLGEAAWGAYFADARPLVFDDHRLVVAVGHAFVKERIEQRYMDALRVAVTDIAETSITIELEVLARQETDGGSDNLRRSIPETPPEQPSHVSSETRFTPSASGSVPSTTPSRADEPLLNPRYTFMDFVQGSNNRFACNAAMAVAEKPARSYNPLFIYGDSGLGKTHLLQAIGHYVKEMYPQSRVRYVSTETFVTQFVDAIRTNTTNSFKRRYRDDCDVLLVDDIQFMEGKEGTQEEFFHTFNFLHQSGRQIVLSSDRPPKAIPTLEDRLRSRFEWGLITDVTPPDLETRLAILRKKADREKITVPLDILTFIATHITDNIRELEGALNRVCAYAGLNRETLTLPLAEQVLSDLLSNSEPRPITSRAILDATAEMFGFPIAELTGQSRRRPLVTARQVGMYVFRELTDFSYPMIGREFGGRDHTTVIHAVEKITELMKERREIFGQVNELIRIIKLGGQARG
jgi:chromosomal replication initiator protein